METRPLFAKKRPASTDNIPATHRNNTPKGAWYEIYVKPMVERNRAYMLTMVLAACCLILSAAVFELIPLHKDVPWIVPVNAETGTPTSRPIQIKGQFTPSQLEVQYFMAVWVRDMLTLNRSLTVGYLKHAYGETQGPAVQLFKNWVGIHKPIYVLETKPGLISTVTIDSTSFMSPGHAFIRATRVKEVHGKNTTQQFDITISYTLTPPTTVEQAYANPIGFKVVNFSITPSLSQP
jgi:type IV secretory pathway component VirB8